MAKDGRVRTPRTAAEERAARLKAALKANMARRKAQARARGTGAGQENGADSPEKKGS